MWFVSALQLIFCDNVQTYLVFHMASNEFYLLAENKRVQYSFCIKKVQVETSKQLNFVTFKFFKKLNEKQEDFVLLMTRLQVVPISPLEFVEPRKRHPAKDELKRKNGDCSWSRS